MQVNRISAVNNYSANKANGLNRNQNQARKNDVSFRALTVQVAKDSFAPVVQKDVARFLDYMRNITIQAINKNAGAFDSLKKLIGSDTATAAVKDPAGYTKACENIAEKVSPQSGYGRRGEEIRNMITNALDKPATQKANVPLPAIIGKGADGENIYLTTGINEILHMMEAKVLSPLEKTNWIVTDKSDGDATVVIEGLKRGIFSTDKPLLFTYTDDVGTKGFEDYSKLIERYKELGADSPVEVITRGFLATKEQAAGKLGTFLPNADGKSYAVHEKPAREVIDKLAPEQEQVMTNIGKTLFTPKGLKEIESRIPADSTVPSGSLTIFDSKEGVDKWHITVGVLDPAGKRGVLDVIPKGGQFCDVGNGTDFTDTMVKIATGEMKDLFPESLEAQIRKNVTLAPDGLSAALNYDGKIATLPTTKGKEMSAISADGVAQTKVVTPATKDSKAIDAAKPTMR